MKRFFGIVLILSSALVGAQESTFSTTLGTAILCLDEVEPGFFYNYMTKIKPSYKREQGAYWFKTATQLFGAPVTEVFVSDGSSPHHFVGIVSSMPPDQLADAVSANAPAGVVFKKKNKDDKYSTYLSRTGSVIAFQGKFGKIYCRRDRLID